MPVTIEDITEPRPVPKPAVEKTPSWFDDKENVKKCLKLAAITVFVMAALAAITIGLLGYFEVMQGLNATAQWSFVGAGGFTLIATLVIGYFALKSPLKNPYAGTHAHKFAREDMNAPLPADRLPPKSSTTPPPQRTKTPPPAPPAQAAASPQRTATPPPPSGIDGGPANPLSPSELQDLPPQGGILQPKPKQAYPGADPSFAREEF